MPYPGHKSITLDEQTLGELKELQAQYNFRTLPELLRAIIRKKEQVKKFLYKLWFSKALPVSATMR